MSILDYTDVQGILRLFQDDYPKYHGSFFEVLGNWPNNCWFGVKNGRFIGFHPDTLALLKATKQFSVALSSARVSGTA